MNQKSEQEMIQLNKNENLYGPSPLCYDVIKNVSVDDFIYYSRESVGKIEQEVSKIFNIPTDQVILGYGAEDIIKNIFTHYVFPGDKVIIPDYSWWYYTALVKQRDAEPFTYAITAEGTEYKADVDNILQLKRELNPKLILICSPNNPTGDALDINELEKILEENKNNGDKVICLDETYSGFSSVDTTAKVMEYLQKYENFVVIRSFSKYYALAGIRIAFAFCGKKAKESLKFFDKILGFNRLSEELAIAALRSEDYYKKIVKIMIEDREQMYQDINKIPGFTAYKSEANFILAKMPAELKKPLDEALKEKGFIIKFFKEASFPDCVRISLGTREQNQIVLETIKEQALVKTV